MFKLQSVPLAGKDAYGAVIGISVVDLIRTAPWPTMEAAADHVQLSFIKDDLGGTEAEEYEEADDIQAHFNRLGLGVAQPAPAPAQKEADSSPADDKQLNKLKDALCDSDYSIDHDVVFPGLIKKNDYGIDMFSAHSFDFPGSQCCVLGWPLTDVLTKSGDYFVNELSVHLMGQLREYLGTDTLDLGTLKIYEGQFEKV